MSGGKSVFWARQMFNMSRAKQPRSFWIWIQDSEVLPTMAWGLRFCTVHESRQALYCLGIQCMLFTGLFYWHKENSFQETIWAGSVQQQLLAKNLFQMIPRLTEKHLLAVHLESNQSSEVNQHLEIWTVWDEGKQVDEAQRKFLITQKHKSQPTAECYMLINFSGGNIINHKCRVWHDWSFMRFMKLPPLICQISFSFDLQMLRGKKDTICQMADWMKRNMECA